MFGRAIWDKLPECIFEKFQKIHYPINHSNQTCGYCLIIPNQQRICIETNIFQQQAITNQQAGTYKTAGNYKKTPLMVQC